MRRIATVAALCWLLVSSSAHVAYGEDAATRVELDRTAATAIAGEEIRFTATVHNTSRTPAAGQLALLSITSLDPDVYVDPEDWSSERTQYLAPLPAGARVTTSWHLKAVGSGRFIVFVSVLGGQPGSTVGSSDMLRLDVRSRRTLSAGGVVPVAIAVPAGVLALMLVTRRRIRRPG